MSRQELNEQFQNISYMIFDIECPILDISERCGSTKYIDFISPDEIIEAVNKGTDKYGRKFITFRANIEYNDGSIIETFTTLFQRYPGNELLLMGAGKQQHLFRTEGGTSLPQMNLLLKLLQEHTVVVTQEMMNDCRLAKSTEEMIYDCSLDKPFVDIIKNKPVRIYLQKGKKTKIEETREKVEDVMRDLEYKVNPKSLEEGLNMLATSIKTNNPSIITSPMKAGATEFQERVGRPMTYSEMRMMWG